MKKMLFFCFLLSTTLSGCGLIYRIDVQQGNVINQDMVAQLKPGMDEKQVRYIMGNPLAVSVFHQHSTRQRWDYFYSYKKGWDEAQTRRLTLHMENGVLTRIDGDIERAIGTLPGDPPVPDKGDASPIL
jgi:outer membrane protein assembly factor BamE